MIASVASRVARTASRNISTSLQRAGDHNALQGRGQWPKVGSNLPFSIKNRYKLTLYMALFTGSAFGLPFYMWIQKS